MKPKGFLQILTTLWLIIGNCAAIDRDCNDFDCFQSEMFLPDMEIVDVCKEADNFSGWSNLMAIGSSNKLTHHLRRHHLHFHNSPNHRRSGFSSIPFTSTTNVATISQCHQALRDSEFLLVKIILSIFNALYSADGLSKDISHLDHYHSRVDEYSRSLNQSILQQQNTTVTEAVVNLFELFDEFPPKKYLNVLESCGLEDNIQRNEMLQKIEDLTNFLSQVFRRLKNIYSFIKQTEIHMREYLVFNKLQQMDLTTLTIENVVEFLEKNDLTRDKPDDDTREFFFTEQASDQVRIHMVNVIRNKKPWLKISCKHNEQLIVSGNTIRLSDVFSNQTLPSTCEMEKVTKIFLVASDTTFFDHSVIKNDAVKNLEDLSILSPTWVVVGGEKSRIDLSGRNGIGGAGAKKCETSYGGGGTDGESGSAGHKGGKFWGVLSQLENGADLLLSTSGGNGGNGGQGGEGCLGRRGKDAGWDDLPSASIAMPYLPYLPLPVEQHKPGTFYIGEILGSGLIGDGYRGSMWGTHQSYFVTGHRGGVGGNGGNGGNAGPGGISGWANILQVSGTHKYQIEVEIDNKKGIDGKPGAAGNGGMQGTRGDNYDCWWYNDAFQTKFEDCYVFKNNPANFIRTRTGAPGRNGVVSILPPRPQSQPSVSWRAINHFKRVFFSDLLRNPENSTQTFLHTLNHNPELLPYFVPVGFANELLIIEQEHFSRGLQQTQKLVPVYNVLLQRIWDYAISRNKTDFETGRKTPFTKPEQVALNFVYSSAVGKLTGMRGMRNVIKVVNTTNYFDYLKHEMDILKEDKKQMVIQKESVKYRALLDGKVKESLAFIKNVVLPAIDKAESTMKDDEEKMKGEMISYLNSTTEDLHKKEKAMKSFQNQSVLRYIFGAMRIAGAATSFLGPGGEAAALGLEIASGVAQPLLLGGEAPSSSTLELPESVFNSPNSVLLFDKINSIEKEVNKMEEFISTNKTAFAELDKEIKKLKEIVNKYKYEEAKSTYQEQVKAVKTLDDKRKEFKTWLEKRISSNEKDKAFSETAMTNLRWIRNTLTVGTAAWDFYENVVHASSEKQKSLEAAVEEAKYNVKAVEQKTDQMYNIFIPFLEKMTKHMKSNETDLSGKSQSALIVKKWEVQQILLQMKNQMASFTKGMKVSEQIQFSVDMLHNAMNLLIDLYNNIETYEEKKQLADYIANINSIPDAAATAQTDPEMTNLVPKLKFSIHANLFLAKYQLALNTFKQWVFPFGDDYIAEDPEVTDLTVFEHEKSDIKMLVEKCMKKIQILDGHLQLYRSAIVKSDMSLYTHNFTSSAVSSSPFYVWKNKDWKNSIERLLAGYEVKLNADIRLAEPTLYGKGAIKFKTVRIHLNAKNPQLQDELDHVLDHFLLSMVHSGVSNYQVNGKDYITFDNPLDLRYSFEKGVTENKAIGKLDESGDFLLSPYTMWTLQLKKPGTSKDLDFSALKRFAGEVDLELAGFGSYIDDKPSSHSYIISDDTENYRYYYREAADYVKNESM